METKQNKICLIVIKTLFILIKITIGHRVLTICTVVFTKPTFCTLEQRRLRSLAVDISQPDVGPHTLARRK